MIYLCQDLKSQVIHLSERMVQHQAALNMHHLDGFSGNFGFSSSSTQFRGLEVICLAIRS